MLEACTTAFVPYGTILNNTKHLLQLQNIDSFRQNRLWADHDLHHYDYSLPLREVVQDLDSTDRTHRKHALDNAGYIGSLPAT